MGSFLVAFVVVCIQMGGRRHRGRFRFPFTLTRRKYNVIIGLGRMGVPEGHW